MERIVDGRVTVIVDRDEQGARWRALVTMRFNEAARVQAGQPIELSAFSKRLSGTCRTKADWKMTTRSVSSSDPLFFVPLTGEGPLLFDGRDITAGTEPQA